MEKEQIYFETKQDRNEISSSSVESKKKSSLSSGNNNGRRISSSRSRSRSQLKRTRYRSRSKTEDDRKNSYEKNYKRKNRYEDFNTNIYNNNNNNNINNNNNSPYNNFNKFKAKKQQKIYMPLLDGPLVSYRTFMENQNVDINRDKAENLYKIYRKDWENKQYEIFFGEHKEEQWFKEKYNPQFAEKFKFERQKQAQINSQKFGQLFQENFYQNIDFEIDSKTLQNSMKKQNDDNSDENNEDNNNNVVRPINFFTEIYIENNILQAPYFGFDPNCMTLFIKAVPKNISRWEILETLEKVKGFLSLSLSEPLKSHDFSRFGWILFDSEENCNKAAYDLNNFMIKNHVFNIVKSRSQKKPIKVITKLDNERVKTDLELSMILLQEMDQEKGILNNIINEENKEFSEQGLFKQLDLQLLYLRKVHSYCYYCAAEHYDERMLAAKCGSIHLRLTTQLETINVPDWHQKMIEINQKRILQCKNKPQESALLIIEKELETKLEKKIQKKSQQARDDTVWPCISCEKIFQSMVYLVKHYKNKHEKVLLEMKEKIIEDKMYENYVNDPHRMMGPSQNMNNVSQFPNQVYKYNKINNRRQDSKLVSMQDKKEYKDYDEPQQKNPFQSQRGFSMINYNDI